MNFAAVAYEATRLQLNYHCRRRMARAYRGYLCIRGISRYFNTVRPSSDKWRNEVSESPSSSDGPARALWCARCRQYMSLSQEPKRVFCLFFSSLFFDARGILHFIFIFFSWSLSSFLPYLRIAIETGVVRAG